MFKYTVAFVAFFVSSVLAQSGLPFPSGCDACSTFGQSVISKCKTTITTAGDDTILSIASCLCPLIVDSGVDCRTCINASATHKDTAATTLYNQVSDLCAKGKSSNSFNEAAAVIAPIIRQSIPSATSAGEASLTASVDKGAATGKGPGVVTATTAKAGNGAERLGGTTVMSLGVVAAVALLL
ncbi:hypothetical protein HDU97_008078 [Phlyctochytrium planicorne]|nr:hypothetical protein HDU97_008078 [Phlyctochytrium planicorne]